MDTEIFPTNERHLDNNKGLTMTYGLLTGLGMIVYSLVLHFSAVSLSSWLNYLVLAILLGGIILFCFAFSKSRGGSVTFGNIFGAGFRMVAFTTLIMLGWALLSQAVLPGMKERALEYAREAMVKQGSTEAQIEKAMSFTRDKYTLITVVTVMFSNVIYGSLFTLLGAAIAPKNKKNDPFQ